MNLFQPVLLSKNHFRDKNADSLLHRLLDEGHEFALAPQTLAEFLHVVTDSRRMKEPLSMGEALASAEDWWQAREVFKILTVLK